MKLTHSRAVLITVVVALMWSTAGVVIRQLESARSFEITFWRSFFMALSLLVMLSAWQERYVFTRIRKAGSALWSSGVCWGVMFTAFMLALPLTSVANVLLTLGIGSFLTALVSCVVIGHRLMPGNWGPSPSPPTVWVLSGCTRGELIFPVNGRVSLWR